MKPASTLQPVEHPARPLLSHSSPGSTMPLPHKPQSEAVPKTALHLQPVSGTQFKVQPTLLPLSHCSPWSMIESPQTGYFMQRELLPGLPQQVQLGPVKQLLHPALLPLSHYSPASRMALPQVVQAGAVGKAGLVQNLSQYVYKVRE